MRLVFAGTPDFAVPALDALAKAGHDLVAVYTQPDRPAGRGRKLQATPVARRAGELGLPLRKFEKLRDDALADLRAQRPDAMVVVAYGLILPQAVLDIPRLGCFNIHASLLPRWRGAAPIQRAVLAGDAETGVTIMRMEAGLDTGPMLLQEKVPIGSQASAADLHDALAALGARMIVTVLQGIAAGTLRETPQPAAGVTYAAKITKEEARIDWRKPAVEISRHIHAFNPAPVAWSELDGERVRIFRAAISGTRAEAAPGTILSTTPQGIHVATGDGTLALTELQWPGGRVLTAAEAAGRSLGGHRFA